MGWFSDLFSSGSLQKQRNGHAMSLTSEAFSAPRSSSPIHPDAFNADLFMTEPDSAISPTYTYPPQSGAYGYMQEPTNGSHSRPRSLLPMHLPHSEYPPLSQTWARLRTWLAREYPELGDTLNYGILPPDLAQIEMQFGFALPDAIRDSYLEVDGQEAESSAGCSEGLFFGLTLLPLEDVLEEWRFWREVDDDPTTGANPRLQEHMSSIPPGYIRTEYSQRGWIPLIADKAGNYLGVDLNPGPNGTVGQVIVFGRDYDTKVVMWKGDGRAGWAKWLAAFVQELELGETYELGATHESEGSEDDLGYDSYFSDGTSRGQGEGGGDSGAAGMRLTGDYRGWSTLDAWADRSLRQWHAAGALPKRQTVEPTIDLEAVPSIDISSEPSTEEKPIPVVSEPSPKAPKQRTLPSISVTKPPAPLPVVVPTADDILIMEEEEAAASYSQLEEDLEAGYGRNHRRTSARASDEIGMREVFRDVDTPVVSPTTPKAPYNAKGTKFVARVTSPPAPELIDPSESTKRAAPTPLDLMADSAPTLGVAPITPTSPLPPKSPLHNKEPPTISVNGAAAGDGEDDDYNNPDADATIRLVGGGGVTGSTSDLTLHSPDADDQFQISDGGNESDDGSVASETSNSSIPDKEVVKRHKKTRSGLAGLKKLGKFGGLRNKDSIGSAKDMK